VTNSHRRTVRGLYNGGSNVVRIRHQAYRADVQSLLSALDETSTGIDIVVAQRLFHLTE
jgi:hypothetical protein